MVLGEKELPKTDLPKEPVAHVAIVDGNHLATKAELLDWLDQTEKRFNKKHRESDDPETVRESFCVVQALEHLRNQLNPKKEEDLLKSPVDLRARLAVAIEKFRPVLVEPEE